MMPRHVEARKYHLTPTSLIPNSPLPLLHYPGFFNSNGACDTSTEASPAQRGSVGKNPSTPGSATDIALQAHNLLAEHGWETEWIYRYGPTQPSHYHSRVHECMVVLSGTARIRFGLEDDDSTKRPEPTVPKQSHDNNTGIIVDAQPGDVFILPAGTAHKTYDATPRSAFALLTPGNGHGIVVEKNKKQSDISSVDDKSTADEIANTEQARAILSQIEFSGFTMLGAYPLTSAGEWDFATGGEDVGRFEKVWSTPVPEKDPVLENSAVGLCSTWNRIDLHSKA